MTDACPSCGVLYVDHHGLHGTCRELQQLKRQIRDFFNDWQQYTERLLQNGICLPELDACLKELQQIIDPKDQ